MFYCFAGIIEIYSIVTTFCLFMSGESTPVWLLKGILIFFFMTLFHLFGVSFFSEISSYKEKLS